MNNIDFYVPLSGSQIFDVYTIATAQRLTAKYPGLKYDTSNEPNDRHIHIYGELNDMWYREWCKDVYANMTINL